MTGFLLWIGGFLMGLGLGVIVERKGRDRELEEHVGATDDD